MIFFSPEFLTLQLSTEMKINNKKEIHKCEKNL